MFLEKIVGNGKFHINIIDILIWILYHDTHLYIPIGLNEFIFTSSFVCNNLIKSVTQYDFSDIFYEEYSFIGIIFILVIKI